MRPVVLLSAIGVDIGRLWDAGFVSQGVRVGGESGRLPQPKPALWACHISGTPRLVHGAWLACLLLSGWTCSVSSGGRPGDRCGMLRDKVVLPGERGLVLGCKWAPRPEGNSLLPEVRVPDSRGSLGASPGQGDCVCDPQGQRGWGAWEEGGLGLGPQRVVSLGPAKGTEGAFRGEEGPEPWGGVSTMPPGAARGPVSLPRALAREHADSPPPPLLSSHSPTSAAWACRTGRPERRWPW